MSNGQDESHPLFIHSIVLFLVAAILVVMGIIGIVAVAKESGGGSMSLKDIQKADQDAQAMKRTAGTAGKAPTGLGDAARKAEEAKRMAEQAKKLAAKGKAFIVPILVIVWALATGASGFFLLKRANWARFAGIACISGTLLYYTWLQSAANGVKEIDFAVWRPLVLILIAGLAGKFLWDMAVEKLEAAPAA